MMSEMTSQEEIFTQLKAIMVDLFEINEVDIRLDASLYDDLDLDSIDAIDMVVRLQAIVGKKIEPEDFKNARIVQDVVDAMHKLIHS